MGFEPTRERNPLPVFKTGALNHSAILPEPNPTSSLPSRLEKVHRRRICEVGGRPGPKRPNPDLTPPSSSLRLRCPRMDNGQTQTRAMAGEPWPNRPDMGIASSPIGRPRQRRAKRTKGRPRSLVNPMRNRSLRGSPLPCRRSRSAIYPPSPPEIRRGMIVVVARRGCSARPAGAGGAGSTAVRAASIRPSAPRQSIPKVNLRSVAKRLWCRILVPC